MIVPLRLIDDLQLYNSRAQCSINWVSNFTFKCAKNTRFSPVASGGPEGNLENTADTYVQRFVRTREKPQPSIKRVPATRT